MSFAPDAAPIVFTTHRFLFVFLPLALAVYYALPGRFRSFWIAVASYCLYGWSTPWWAALMFLSTLIDYVCGLALVRLSALPDEDGLPPMLPRDGRRCRGQTAALAISVGSNVALLAYFKYFSAARALPPGISFYTFQSMSYAIDVYRGDARATRSLVDFCCFESFFPQLVAGPIVRYSQIAEQIRQRTHTWNKFARGIGFFACGMAKKVLISDALAPVADMAFTAVAQRWYDAWFGLISFSFQAYFDFSGYSDMAIGLALMMGFRLSKNFDSPYLSKSFGEIWRRWHISLSTWFRDYVYVPLGGNRHSLARTCANLMLITVISGIWHGASLAFLVWGILHGAILIFERLAGRERLYRGLPGWLRIAAVFAAWNFTLIFFRAASLEHAWRYMKMMAGTVDVPLGPDLRAACMYTPYQLGVFALAAAVVWGAPNTWQFTRRLSWVRALVCALLLVASVAMMWTQSYRPYLYFQF